MNFDNDPGPSDFANDPGPNAPQGPSPEAVRASMIGGQARSLGQDARDAVLNGLPAFAGMGGGLVGGAGGTVFGAGFGGLPGAVTGSAIAGAGGEALAQLLRRALGQPAPETPGAAAGAIAGQGALQGGMELAGQGLMRGVGMAGHGMMKTAIGAGQAIQREAEQVAGRLTGQRAIPDAGALAAQAIRERAGATRAGFQKVGATIQGAADRLATALDAAGQKGVRLRGEDFLGPMRELWGEIAKESDPKPILGALQKKIARFIDAHGLMDMTPAEANELKQVWQDTAQKIYKSGDAGPRQTFRARYNATLARGARQSIEGVVPEAAGENARMSSLMPLQDAIGDALRSPNPPLPFLPKLVSNAVVPQAIPTRAIMSGLALGATDPYFQMLLRQAPHLATYFQTAPPSQGGEP